MIGNCIVGDTMNLNYHPSPTVNIGNDTALCGTDEFTVQATSQGAVSYLWNDGDVNSFKQITSQGTYWLEVISADGCVARDTLVIDGFGCEFYLFVPNVFTPNGDKRNETFFPLGYNVVSGNMQIWDRWGELLYETNDLTKGWDGTFKDKDCPIDAYVWVVNFSGYAEDGSLQTKIKVGTVTLLR
jgi:gliding motility-associated-like protein